MEEIEALSYIELICRYDQDLSDMVYLHLFTKSEFGYKNHLEVKTRLGDLDKQRPLTKERIREYDELCLFSYYWEAIIDIKDKSLIKAVDNYCREIV